MSLPLLLSRGSLSELSGQLSDFVAAASFVCPSMVPTAHISCIPRNTKIQRMTVPHVPHMALPEIISATSVSCLRLQGHCPTLTVWWSVCVFRLASLLCCELCDNAGQEQSWCGLAWMVPLDDMSTEATCLPAVGHFYCHHVAMVESLTYMFFTSRATLSLRRFPPEHHGAIPQTSLYC